jgi:hypothetical protein
MSRKAAISGLFLPGFSLTVGCAVLVLDEKSPLAAAVPSSPEDGEALFVNQVGYFY